VDTPAFLPHLEGLRLDEYTATAGRIALRVATTTATAPCPACQHPSRRIHSRYVHMVADVARERGLLAGEGWVGVGPVVASRPRPAGEE